MTECAETTPFLISLGFPERRSWRLRKGRVVLASAVLIGLGAAFSQTTFAETEPVPIMEGPVEIVDEVPGFDLIDVESGCDAIHDDVTTVADVTQLHTLEIDLVTGQVTGSSPFVTFVAAPRDTNRDGYCEAVLVVDLEHFAGLELRADYTGDPRGFTLNVGDSRTNNGYAGDGATQSNDAEFQIRGSELSVWGNDDVPSSQRNLATVKGVVQQGGHIEFALADGYMGWGYEYASERQLQSPYLFALRGQADREGPVNHDVFLAFNRVISGTYRSGSGLGKVTIRLIPRRGCR